MSPEDMNSSASNCTAADELSGVTTSILNSTESAEVKVENVKEAVVDDHNDTAEVHTNDSEIANNICKKVDQTLVENSSENKDVEDDAQVVKEIVEELKNVIADANEAPASSSEISNDWKNDDAKDAINISDEEIIKEVIEELTNIVAGEIAINAQINCDNQAAKIADDLPLLNINENEETGSDEANDFQKRIKNVLSYFKKNEAKEAADEEQQENPEDEEEEFTGDDVIGRFMTCFRKPYEKEQAEFYASAEPEYTNEKILALLTENLENMTEDKLKLLEHFQLCCLKREYRRDVLATKALKAIQEIQDQRKMNLKEVERQYEARMAKIENQFWNLSTELMEQYNEIDASGDENDD